MASLDLDTMNIGCCRKYLRSNQVIIKVRLTDCVSRVNVKETLYLTFETPSMTVYVQLMKFLILITRLTLTRRWFYAPTALLLFLYLEI